ncbi:MAG: hypothetical protein CM15mP102_04050 [Flavobacteriales bacterium]|nr:MAG: hypothetical protein CM15mP102_04050 [Flavobacteriales bacterium]
MDANNSRCTKGKPKISNKKYIEESTENKYRASSDPILCKVSLIFLKEGDPEAQLKHIHRYGSIK